MEVAALVALLGLAGTVGSLVYLHLAPTGLSPIQNPVSQYGITPYRGGYRAATLAFALAGAGLLWALVQGGIGGRLELVALGVFVLARAAISWFPMDAPDAPRTATGRWHGVLAAAAFVGIALAAQHLRAGVASAALAGFAGPSRLLGLGMAACLLLMVLVGRSSAGAPRSFGAVERVFYVLAIVWSVLLAAALL